MFDINNNLFGYISKSTEMSTNIIQRYKNSLIFIGDEKQIYIPTTNSYVGIGLSYLNQVLNERTSNADKIYIENIANNGQVNSDTTYYFPVINGTTPNTYYHTYVALNVGVDPVGGKFIGDLKGTADYSTVSHVTYKNTVKTTNTNSTYYISFTNQLSGDSYTYVNSNLQYNPNTKTLTTETFKGNLDGNAKTATNAVNSTYSTYATYSHFNSYQSIHLLNNQTDKTFYITFGLNSSYSLSYIDNSFKYNTKTQTLTVPKIVATNIVGNIEGTANYSKVSNLTYQILVNSTNTDSSYYLPFINKIGEGSYAYANNKLLYNPHQELLTSTYFSGYLLGWATYASYASYSTYTTYTTYALFNSYQSIHKINNDSNYYITFGKNLTYTLSYMDDDFYYNPALNSVYAGHFYGTFHGDTDMFTKFTGGNLTSSGNYLTQSAHTIKIGNTEKSSGESNNIKIINSAEWAYVGSTSYIQNTAYNLVLRYKINGINSSYAYIPKLIAYSASYFDGVLQHDNLPSLYWANIPIQSQSDSTKQPTFGKVTISGGVPHLDMYSTNSQSSIYFRPNSGTQWAIGKSPWGDDGFGIGIIEPNGCKLSILDNGNVGIGVTNPLEKLDVNGDMRIRGNNGYLGTTSGQQCHMQYDNTNQCLNFIFD